MLLLTRRSSRHKHLKRLLWLVTAAVIAIVGWKTWQLGVPRYKTWKQQRALAQAKEFLAARDPQNAQLALEVALKTLPGNIDAVRLAAEMLEQVGAPQALRLRRDVVRLRPDSSEDVAALIYAALKFRDFNAARDALGAMKPAVAAEPPALRAALAFALATDNKPIADAVFDRLKEASPDDTELRFAHATLRLKHPDEKQRATAREEVEAFARQDPRFALRAYRELSSLALQKKDYPAARQALQRAAAAPKATINEHLQLANLDLLIDGKPFAAAFAHLAPLAAQDADSAQQFVQWLLVQRRVQEAHTWFSALPGTMMQERGMASTRADITAAQARWEDLLRQIESGAWGSIPAPSVRLVSAARAIDAQKRPALRRDTWGLAIEATNGGLTGLRVLHRLASIWGWDEEAEATLWAVARSYPDQVWAHQTLFNVYRTRRNTAGMRDVMGVLRQADPAVTRYQHDWALLSVLLDPSTNWTTPKRTLEELHNADKANPHFATSYAFALALTGKKKESLDVLAALPPDELGFLPRLPYLAYIYGAANDPAMLAKLTAASAEGDYLPEESALFRRAQEVLHQKPAPPPKTKSTANPDGKP